MAITDTNIYTSTWDSIRAKLVAASMTVDSTVVSIKAAFNDTYTKPQIVIYPIDKREPFDKFGGSEGKKTLTVNVECFYKTSAGVDSMAEQVEAVLKADDIAGIDLINVDSNTSTPLDPNDSKFHTKMVGATYTRE